MPSVEKSSITVLWASVYAILGDYPLAKLKMYV